MLFSKSVRITLKFSSPAAAFEMLVATDQLLYLKLQQLIFISCFSFIILKTNFMFSALATEVPPNFNTFISNNLYFVPAKSPILSFNLVVIY
jgi:hypothetical protein